MHHKRDWWTAHEGWTDANALDCQSVAHYHWYNSSGYTSQQVAPNNTMPILVLLIGAALSGREPLVTRSADLIGSREERGRHCTPGGEIVNVRVLPQEQELEWPGARKFVYVCSLFMPSHSFTNRAIEAASSAQPRLWACLDTPVQGFRTGIAAQ
jgi:hypothetical protein